MIRISFVRFRVRFTLLLKKVQKNACMDARKPVIYPLLKSAGVLAQLVRALACHARGRGFESRTSRHPMNDARFAGLFLFCRHCVVAT